MKVNLDIPINIGDSIFFFDVMKPEAQVTNIYIEYEEYKDEPSISLGWVQVDRGPDGFELWDEGDVNLKDLEKTFWLTYEDMINANKEDWVRYQIIEDRQLQLDYNQETNRCFTQEKVGCEGCPYMGKCDYTNAEQK